MRFTSAPKSRRQRPPFPAIVEICEPRTLLTNPGFLAGEVPAIDGMGNNLDHPEWGSTDEMLLRLAPENYADDSGMPAGSDRLSARTVSNAMATAHEPKSNDRNLTDILWLWGQFVDHDIDLTEGASPAEPMPISVPAGDPYFDVDGSQTIGLNRSIYMMDNGVRQQINEITAFIDGSTIYGSDPVRTDALRSHEGGRLRMQDTSVGDLLPFNDGNNSGNIIFPNASQPFQTPDQLFLSGDVRANENVALTSMHTLWVREHNRIADEISAQYPNLTDEQIFQQTRAIVRAEIQAITYNEYLPALLGFDAIGPYQGYDPDVNPDIANEFSTAAYRFGHSMLSSELSRRDAEGDVIDAGNLSLQNAFFNPGEIYDPSQGTGNGIDPLLRGMTTTIAQEIDTQVVDDVRNFLFGPPGAGGFDLAALNIQRGRDHGLSSYNDTRQWIGLPRVTSFSDVSSDPHVVEGLASMYGSVDDIDLWVGGLAEDHLPGSSMGETFSTIITDQFERLRDGDRFWYQNVFHGEQLAELESTTLADVIERNTGIQDLQPNVFFDASVLYVDLAASHASNVTVRVADGELQVVEGHNGRVIASQSLGTVQQLILDGSDRTPNHIAIESIAGDLLPGGIVVNGGSGRGDVLRIEGTHGEDVIGVTPNEVTVNGLVIQFSQIERIEIQTGQGDDEVDVADEVDLPVIVDRGEGGEHRADPWEQLFGSQHFLDLLHFHGR